MERIAASSGAMKKARRLAAPATSAASNGRSTEERRVGAECGSKCRRRVARCALVTGVQTCALPIWLVRPALQRVQRGEPLGRGAERGRAAVVGKAIPGGEGKGLQLRREIMGGIDDGAHRGFVRRNENGPSPGRTCEVGGEPRQESGGSTGQRHRLVGRKDFLEVGHLADRKSTRLNSSH